MRIIITLLIIGLLVGCTAKEAAKDTEVVSEIPVSGVDAGGVVVNETPETEAEDHTDLTTSQDTFDALDEAVGELE